MSKGLALNIGLNAVDSNHYGGWSGKLNACESDANDMAAIAKLKGFVVTTLLTDQATRSNVIGEIKKAAKELIAGDIFFLTYSGHGGQIPDLNGDEPDGQDETWCLYNGQLIDDETYTLLAMFPLGSRILVFSDSCHSGSVLKMMTYNSSERMPVFGNTSPETRYKYMPPEVAQRTYRNNKQMYDLILEEKRVNDIENSVKASVILISGCQDNQLSSDGTFNGLFTANLLQVWNHGKFKDSYKRFHREIVNRMPPNQTPNYLLVGQSNSEFERQVPFTL